MHENTLWWFQRFYTGVNYYTLYIETMMGKRDYLFKCPQMGNKSRKSITRDKNLPSAPNTNIAITTKHRLHTNGTILQVENCWLGLVPTCPRRSLCKTSGYALQAVSAWQISHRGRVETVSPKHRRETKYTQFVIMEFQEPCSCIKRLLMQVLPWHDRQSRV